MTRYMFLMSFGLIFLLLVSTIFLLGAFDPLPDAHRIDLRARLLPPGTGHYLGTDDVGRDVLSRIMEGARRSVASALASVVVAIGLGWPLGLAARSAPGAVGRPLWLLACTLFVLPAALLRPRWPNRMLMTLCCAAGALPVTWIGLAAVAEWNPSSVGPLVVMGSLFVPAVASIASRGRSPGTASASLALSASSLFVWFLVLHARLDMLGLGARLPNLSLGMLLIENHGSTILQAMAGLCLVLAGFGAFCLGDAVSSTLRRRATRT